MNPLELPKDFWRTVKSEIETAESANYTLCDRSATFAAAWNNRELSEQISALASEYLTIRPANYIIGYAYLFVRKANSGITGAEAKQFRTDFVNWCVENNR